MALLLKDAAQFITAHVAVLKTGKFSLNLDIAAPRARTAHLLEDSQAAAIIVDDETASFARERLGGERQIIHMDEMSSGNDDENLELRIAPDNYCYLRYTSGSTGEAKAGVKTHRQVMHTVMNATNAFHVCHHDRSVLLTRDSCLGKYAFETLLNGAALCPFFVANQALVELARWISEEEITLYYSFPAALRHLLSALPETFVFSRIRLVRVEGEPTYKRDVEGIRRHFGPGCILANSFSSTAALYVCTSSTIKAN